MTRYTGIIRTVDLWDFGAELGEDFSDAAHKALYDYYMELSEDIGEPIELDRVAICCEWYEYDSDEAFISDMSLDDIEYVYEDVADFQGYGELYGYQAYRLDNGGLLVQAY